MDNAHISYFRAARVEDDQIEQYTRRDSVTGLRKTLNAQSQAGFRSAACLK